MVISISESTVFQFLKILGHNWEIRADWKNNIICHFSGLEAPHN